ncbi:MAG: hypothetical protein ACLQDV_07755 [Candidatus Binataceae bacterium]
MKHVKKDKPRRTESRSELPEEVSAKRRELEGAYRDAARESDRDWDTTVPDGLEPEAW